MQHPLSSDEHAAMVRYISSIRKQLQEASDLFTSRYGKDSSVAETAVKALVSTTLFEHEVLHLDGQGESADEAETEETTIASL